MDRALKERLVGAVVVVLLGVVFIPWLLDGPAESGRVVEPGVTLPAGSPGVRTVTIPVGRQADEPTPVPSPPASDPVAPRPDAGSVQRPPEEAPSRPVAATQTPEPAAGRTAPARPPEPAPKPAEASPAPAPATGWAVQVGSFSQADNAVRLKDQLTKDGFAAFVSRVVTDAGTMHRVRVGPVEERDDAEALLGRLVRAGQKGRVVRVED